MNRFLSVVLACAIFLEIPGARTAQAFVASVNPAGRALLKALPRIQADHRLWNDDLERVLGHLSLDLTLGRDKNVSQDLIGNTAPESFENEIPSVQALIVGRHLRVLRQTLDPQAESLLAAMAAGDPTVDQQRQILELDAKFYLLSPALAEKFHREAAKVEWDRDQRELRAIVTEAAHFTSARASQEMIDAARKGIIAGADVVVRSRNYKYDTLRTYALRAFRESSKRLEERGLHGGLLSVAVLENHRELRERRPDFAGTFAVAAIEKLPHDIHRDGERYSRSAAAFAAPLSRREEFNDFVPMVFWSEKKYEYKTLAEVIRDKFGDPDRKRPATPPWYILNDGAGESKFQLHVGYFDGLQRGMATTVLFYRRMRLFKRNILINNPLTAGIVTAFFMGIGFLTTGRFFPFGIFVPHAKRIRQIVHHRFWQGPDGTVIDKGALGIIADKKGSITPWDVARTVRVEWNFRLPLADQLRGVLELVVGAMKVAMEWSLQFLVVWQPRLSRPSTWIPRMTAAELDRFARGMLWYDLANEALGFRP